MVMVALFLVGLVVCDRAEMAPPPQLAGLHIVGPNMEGKEVRFGVGESVLTAIVTSNASTGSYNSIHDSFQPMGVLAPLVFMLLGEVVFGGLGAGVYSIVMAALVGVFLGGLMVGRTPEYLGKKIRLRGNPMDCLVCSLDAHGGAGADRYCGHHEGWPGRPRNQLGTARLHRNPVRLRFLHGQ
jgi:K+-transporting ATPase A subunit